MIIGIISLISAFLLVLAMYLSNKSKIHQMREDWLVALRKQREESYLDGYVNGIADEKIVQAAKKDLTVIIPKIEAVTELIPVIR